MSSGNQPDTALVDAAYPISVGKITLETSKLTDRDFGDLSLWIKSKFIANAVNVGNLLDPISKQEVISVALKDAMDIGWGTPAGMNLISTDEGFIRLSFQMCRKRHPMLTLAQFEKIVAKDVDAKNAWFPLMYVAYQFHHPSQEDSGEEGDMGGSSTVNDKSNEG